MKKTIIIISLTIILLVPISSSRELLAKEDESNHVLIIYSHHLNFQWADELHRGFVDALDTQNTYIYTEYLNEHQLADKTTFQEIYNALSEKYKQLEFDCIIVADNYAYNFMAEYYEELSPDTPLVFVGVNGFSDDIVFTDNMTGIAQNSDMKGLIELITSINDDKIVFVSSKNATSVAGIAEIEGVIRDNFSDLDYSIISAETLDNAIDEINELKNKDAQLIMVGNIITAEGTMLSPQKLITTLYEATAMPIYTGNRLHISDTDKGAIGGVVVDPYIHAYEAALMAKQIIEGVNVREIDIIEEPLTSYIFNYKMMTVFNIEESQLPTNSILIGMEDNFVSLSQEAVISGIIIIVLMLLLLIVMTMVIRLKVKDKNKLDMKNIELNAKNESILNLINIDQVTQFLNHHRLVEVIEELYDDYENFIVYGVTVKNLQSIDEAYGVEYGNQARFKVSQILKGLLENKNVIFARYHDSFYVLKYGSKCCNEQEQTAIKYLITLIEQLF